MVWYGMVYVEYPIYTLLYIKSIQFNRHMAQIRFVDNYHNNYPEEQLLTILHHYISRFVDNCSTLIHHI